MNRLASIIITACLLIALCSCEKQAAPLPANETPAAAVAATATPLPTPSATPAATPALTPEPVLPRPIIASEDDWWMGDRSDADDAITAPSVERESIGYANIVEFIEPQPLEGLSDPRGLACFYPGMVVFIAKDSSGVESIYSGQGISSVKKAYTPGDGIRLAGASGSKYGLYWAEYDSGGAWRVMLLRFAEGASPETLKSGDGTASPPIFRDGYMLLTENTNGVLESRLLNIHMAFDHPIEHLPPVWMDVPHRLFVHDFFVYDENLSMLFESTLGPVSRAFSEWSGRTLLLGETPAACHQVNQRTVWLAESGKLFLYERVPEITHLLADGVSWFNVADNSVFFADRDGRLCVAAPALNDETEYSEFEARDWQVAELLPPKDGTEYLMASHDHFEALALTLMVRRDGQLSLKEIWVGAMGE